MANETKEIQRVIRLYKEKTGKAEVKMEDVVKFAVGQLGWKLPPPTSPLERLERKFSQAAREETRYDKKTNRPYRVNHVVVVTQGEEQFRLWYDIDEAPRHVMDKSLKARREQMVGDGLQLTLDADHWNSIHTDEKPLDIPMDFRDDIEWAKNAPHEKKKVR